MAVHQLCLRERHHQRGPSRGRLCPTEGTVERSMATVIVPGWLFWYVSTAAGLMSMAIKGWKPALWNPRSRPLLLLRTGLGQVDIQRLRRGVRLRLESQPVTSPGFGVAALVWCLAFRDDAIIGGLS